MASILLTTTRTQSAGSCSLVHRKNWRIGLGPTAMSRFKLYCSLVVTGESLGSGTLWPPEPAWSSGVRSTHGQRIFTMRAILLWALGIPIPVIILLYLFHVV